jgi:hypothetical protein
VNQEACPNSLLFYCFHLKLIFESIKELGSASKNGKEILVDADIMDIFNEYDIILFP